MLHLVVLPHPAEKKAIDTIENRRRHGVVRVAVFRGKGFWEFMDPVFPEIA